LRESAVHILHNVHTKKTSLSAFRKTRYIENNVRIKTSPNAQRHPSSLLCPSIHPVITIFSASTVFLAFTIHTN
jgi:hypothetical protein